MAAIGLSGAVEVADDLQHPLVQPDVLRGAAAGDDQGVVVRLPDLVERGVQAEVVAALLGVGLVALEVVDRGADRLPLPLAGADGMHGVAHHLRAWKGTMTS